MVWFSCEDCGDSLKKPKLQAHLSQCSASRLTCLDCNATFDRRGAQAHVRCVTEHEKYALGVTKGLAQAADAGPDKPAGQRSATGLEFLATRPPWRCSLCNVTCTSRETLAGHAAGAKHVRRAKAATAAAQPSAGGGQATPEQPPVANGVAENGSAVAQPQAEAEGKRPADGAEANGHKKKKRKAEQGGAEMQKTQATQANEDALQRVKWKKLAAAELRDGSLPLKKLQKRVLKAAGQPASEAVVAAFERRVTKSSQFLIQGDVVSLA